MYKIWLSLCLLSVGVLYFVTTAHMPLFYDAPEYTDIVSSQGLLQSVFAGHVPIKPFFMTSFWMIFWVIGKYTTFSSGYIANISAFFMGFFSLLLFIILSRMLLKKDQLLHAILLFAMFPVVWVINTNLFAESLALPLYIALAISLMHLINQNSVVNKFLYLVILVALLTTHIQTLLWLPSVIAIPAFFVQKRLIRNLKQIINLSLTAIFISLVIYSLSSLISQKPVLLVLEEVLLGRSREVYHFSAEWWISFARIIRNIFLSITTGFGILTVFLFMLYVVKKHLKPKFTLALVLYLSSVALSAGAWTGDFMGRRIVFASVFLAIFMTYNLGKRAYWLIFYLFVIFFGNTYLSFQEFHQYPLKLISAQQSRLPPQSLLIQTHYLRPFTDVQVKNLHWLGISDPDQISTDIPALVFIDSQAVFAPHLLYVGNNLHITSLGRFGRSESQFLFEKYAFDLYSVENSKERIFIYQIKKEKLDYEKRLELNSKFADDSTSVVYGKAKPGSAVLIYSNTLKYRTPRQRIDYADPLLWAWMILTSKHDPIIWSYADRDGVFVVPVAKDAGEVFVKGEEVYGYQII